jgi:hypothetical protein
MLYQVCFCRGGKVTFFNPQRKSKEKEYELDTRHICFVDARLYVVKFGPVLPKKSEPIWATSFKRVPKGPINDNGITHGFLN